jgi:glycosyltransferase involved in cell wall biosynthesis
LQKDYESLFELAQILGQRLRLQITLQVVGPKYREAQNAIALLSRRYRGVKLQFHSNLSDIEFSDFMLKTDLAIQLRSNWMGEASGVLAQLVVRGVPVITNMDSYSEFRNCHIMNSQSHKEDLFRFIDRISNLNIGESIFDPSQSDVFALDHWSEKMILAAETFRSQVLSNALLIESFKLPEEFIDEQIISRAWNKIFPPLGINIASDVSQLWRETQFSGIQRSTVELHRAILRESDKRQGDLSLSPIDLSSNRNPFTLEIQSLDPLGEYGQLDQSHLSHLLLLQPNYDLVKDNSRLVQIASNGVKVISQIHDLLPITAPSYFHSDFTKEVFLPWIKLVVHVSNKIIVSTSSVLAELEAFASSAEITLPAVEIIPLASFFPTINSRPQTRTRNKFVMVGTIEPRKGHEEVLDVFEIIWSNRGESELHIVGQVGWMMDTFLSRVKRHPQLNNKLFMHGRLTDKELQSHLVTSQACIFASQGEGFGLPIVEAASLGTPLILRDIPVFREVSGNNATFFKDSRDLYLLIHGIDRGSFTPKPSIPPTWTWDEAAVKLLEFVLS